MKAVQLFNITDMDKLYALTPKQWMNMIRGYQHRMLDTQEEQANGAILFAMANNGKSLNSVLNKIKREREKIDMSEDELIEKKKRDEHIKKVQRMEIDAWAKNL